MSDMATAIAIGVGITAGLYAGRGFRDRSRKARIGLSIFHAYVGLIIVVTTIAFIRMNAG